MTMRQAIMTAAQPAVPKKKSSGLKDRKSSSRHAGQSHPDRNRLLAEFFKG